MAEATTPATPVAVVPARVDDRLAPLAAGFTYWLERRLSDAGVPVLGGTRTRTTLGVTQRDPLAARGTRDLLQSSTAIGADRAVLVDLALDNGRIDVLLRVHAAPSGKLLGAGRSAGPASTMSRSAITALERIIPVLGLETPKAPISAPFTLASLSRRARALEALDGGEPARAWDVVRDDATPDGAQVRAEIEQLGQDPALSKLEAARLLAAKGQAEQAWRSILREASGELYAEQPNVDVLITAGDIHLARGKPHEARGYFERAAEVDPGRAEAILGLGQSLSGQQDATGAREAFARAQDLSTDPTHAAELMTRLPELEPTARAGAHLLAAERTRRDLDLPASMTHWKNAIALDPSIAGVAHERAGELQLDLGEHAAALESFRGAIASDGASASRKRSEARALIGMRDAGGAEAALKQALEIDRQDTETLRELGVLYGETNRHAEARQMLEQAVELAPQSPQAHRSLAKVLHQQGELDAAIPHLETADQLSGPTPNGLREMAAIQRKQGNAVGAEKTLEQAIGLAPTTVGLRRDLAAVYREQGREDDATRQMRFVEMLGGTEALQTNRGLANTTSQDDADHHALTALITSFGMAPQGHDVAVLLGVRHAMSWPSLVLDWLMPKTVDRSALARELGGGIDPLYDRIAVPEMDDLVLHATEQLLQFENRASLDAESVAFVNDRLGSSMAFVAVATRGDWLTPSACPHPGQVHLEVRRLSGVNAPGVQILANDDCIDGLETGVVGWNYKAAGVWLLFAIVVLYPFVRGWGKVEVRVKLPENTKAMFSISLTKRPRKVKSKAKGDQDEGEASGDINQKLRKLGRKERPLKRSGKMTFNWVAARRAEYYVTVHGPLFHSISEQLIGDFLEERTAKVVRGRTASVSFDLSPKDCPVEIMVYDGSNVLNGAQVALRGDRSTLRYTSNGGAFLYLPKGRHVVMAGARDRVAEREITIDNFDPKPIVIDLAADTGLAFRGCEAAVAPYLEGNFDLAATALREAGQNDLATVMEARAHESKGNVEEASRLLEQAGHVTQAADLLADSDQMASASLYEEAGEFARAAEIHQAGGDLAAAARAWEAAYEYENAIDCYRQLGDVGQVLALLEKSGDYFEAGRIASEGGEVGRAIQNLQQVDSKHPQFGDACRMLGEILAEQGNRDYALEKLDEAREASGLESLPIELRERYGRMLEDAGRLADAIDVLSSVRREDMHYKDVDGRIAELKQRLTQLEAEGTHVDTQAGVGTVVNPAGTQAAAIEDRYEILEQLGAGGMGVVFKAKDKQLGRMVALKRLPENLSAHPAAIKFFEREARSAAALNHPNIVTLFDAGQANGQYFITMEMLEGTPLDVIVKQHGALAPLAVCQLGVQIATGLHFAHRNKIIHRDIKPANLFLTRDKIVKIMDFGLAKMVEEVRKGATVIGGTPFYLAPEQASGGEVDHRADLYALGVTLYQLASGGLPFTEGDVSHAHRHTPPPDPREFNANIPEPLVELIMKLLQKDPDDRIQKAADVVRVLQGFIDASSGRRA